MKISVFFPIGLPTSCCCVLCVQKGMHIQCQNIIKAQTGKTSLGIIMIEKIVTGSTETVKIVRAGAGLSPTKGI